MRPHDDSTGPPRAGAESASTSPTPGSAARTCTSSTATWTRRVDAAPRASGTRCPAGSRAVGAGRRRLAAGRPGHRHAAALVRHVPGLPGGPPAHLPRPGLPRHRRARIDAAALDGARRRAGPAARRPALDHAALVEPTAVAVHDVGARSCGRGREGVVVGGGPVGLLIAIVARRAGPTCCWSNPIRTAAPSPKSSGCATCDPAAIDVAERGRASGPAGRARRWRSRSPARRPASTRRSTSLAVARPAVPGRDPPVAARDQPAPLLLAGTDPARRPRCTTARTSRRPWRLVADGTIPAERADLAGRTARHAPRGVRGAGSRRRRDEGPGRLRPTRQRTRSDPIDRLRPHREARRGHRRAPRDRPGDRGGAGRGRRRHHRASARTWSASGSEVEQRGSAPQAARSRRYRPTSPTAPPSPRWPRTLAERDRPVDILVNNAGTIARAPAAEHTDADWDRVLAGGPQRASSC